MDSWIHIWIHDGFLDSRWVPGFTMSFLPKGSFKFFVWKTVSQEASPPLWTQFSIGNSDKSFHPKGSFEFSNGQLCPKDRRRLLGHSFPSENLTKAFTLKVPSSFSNGKLCPKRRRRLLGHCPNENCLDPPRGHLHGCITENVANLAGHQHSALNIIHGLRMALR